ncbi:Hypothetical predicted protein [Cloeon dipterum]|uniref:SEFIR domain-containing protein n=1 Tax=Cloeon dipterum TaxID=197152 RepID=A0A8S1E0C4_9INSE|nr:Hypothetical predicted protein [Cloeon dipterum]
MRACFYGIFVLAVVHTLIHCAFASYPRRIPCLNETTPFSKTLKTSFDPEENLISFDWPTDLECDLYYQSELKFYNAPKNCSDETKIERFAPTIFFDLSPCPECSSIKETFRAPYQFGRDRPSIKVCLEFHPTVKICSSCFDDERKKYSISANENIFRRERDQKIYGNFNVNIEPKLRPPLKVYVQMADEAHHKNTVTFDKSELIAWDKIAVQEEDGHSQISTNGSCELDNSAHDTSTVSCRFGKTSILGKQVKFKVFIFDEEDTIPEMIIYGADFGFKIKNYSEKEATKPNDYTVKLVMLLSIFASVSLLGIMVKKRSTIRRNLRCYKNAYQGSETPLSTTNNWNGSRMNLKLVLIYLKKSEQFMEAVVELKKLLCSQLPSSEVIDIFDEDYEKEFNIHGLNFIARLTREEYANCNVKIILIHSDETTVHLLHKRGNLVEREENEKLVQFVNKDLMENPCQLKYNKVYNVCLEKFPLTSPNQRLYFNNLTLYYFPKHSELLCRDLCKCCSVTSV